MDSDSNDLYQAWYDAVVAAFGLSPSSFLMARSLIPLGSTSRNLWDYFDSVPLESDGHYYEPHFFNRFSDGYGTVVNLIIPQAGTAWRDAMGDHYCQWVDYLASSPPIPPGGMLELFATWARRNIPDPAQAQAAITIYEQILNGVVPVAQDRFLKAAGVYAYSRSIDEARDQVRKGPAYKLSFSSSPPAAGVRPREAASFAARLATVQLPAKARGQAESAMTKLAASHVEGKAVFDHQAQVWAAPLEKREIIGAVPYPPWFSWAALRYAYQNPGNTVWPVDMKPTWEQTFGPSGNLRRLVSSIVLVDGVDVVLVSDADLTSGERSALQQAAAAGVTPLFALAASAGLQSAGQSASAKPSLSFSLATNDKTLEIRINSPLGNVMLFGVVAIPPE